MHPLFLRYPSAGGSDWGITLVDRPDYVSYEDVAETLYNEHARSLEMTDLLVVRPPVYRPVLDVSEEVKALLPFTERVPRASLHLLYTENCAIKLSANVNNKVEDRLPEAQIRTDCLDWLREAELYTYVDQSSALFEARGNIVYKAPSQKYCTMFLRVGSVQMRRHTLDAFFFWMLPFLQDRHAILTETWSISSIALNAALLLERYRGSSNGCRVDMLSCYHDGSPDLVPEAHEILRQVAEGGKRRVLVLISAIMSGNSLLKLRETIEQSQADPKNFSFLTLYKLCQGTDIDALCDLSTKTVRGQHFSIVERPDSGSRTIIEIDRHTYFPLMFQEATLKIQKTATQPAKQFFTDYQGSGAISLHRDSFDLNHQRRRHHSIYLAVEAMLETGQFKRKFKERLDEINRCPRLIVVPPHRAGKKMVDIAARCLQERFGESPGVFIHPDLHPRAADTPRDQIEKLGVDDTILVLDDVSVTGQRLSRYQQNLRELNFAGRIYYLVGVSRPESDEAWKLRVRNLRYRSNHQDKQHVVTCVEKVVLPDWSERDCPWCRELAALRLLYKNPECLQSAAKLVRQRIVDLQKAAIGQGLVNNAIWRIETRAGPHLTPNSIFLEYRCATDADTIAAVAAALQQMRIGAHPDRLEASYPHVSVIDSEEYFGETFNDVVLRLAILRSSKRSELERWPDANENERRNKVHDFLLREDVDGDAIRLELAVAMLADKVPRPNLSDSEWERLIDMLDYGLLRRLIVSTP